MANHQYSANQLTADKFIHVRGKLTFSRLASLVDGAERAKANDRRALTGTNAIDVPYTTISLAHAEVEYADPANPTVEELFVAERRFNSRKYPENGLGYSFDNKSPNLPIVGVKNAEGQVEQVILENELANGLDVTLVLRTYKPKKFSNHGLSLDLVLVNEPIRFYASSGVNTQELASRGITFAKPPVQVSGASAAAAGAGSGVQAADGLPPNTDPETGLPTAVPAVAAAVPTVPVVQATPAVVAQPAPAAAPQVLTAAPPMSAEEELRQLKAKIAADEAKKLADANSGGSDSAFGAANDPEDPWVDPVKQPVAQGIEYSG